jgi:hypothetical protein
MTTPIPLAPVRTRREATGARGPVFILITVAGGLAMLLATSCTHNTRSPPNSPPSQSPSQKGGGGGW